MNKTIQKLAFGAIAVSLFTACTSEDGFDQAKKDRLDLGTNASEVAVVIGAGTAKTTTSSEEITPSSLNLNFEGNKVTEGAINSNETTKAFSIQDQKMSIFMLAKGIVPENDYSDVTWNQVSWANHGKKVTIPNVGDYTDVWSAPIWNQAANVNMVDDAGVATEDPEQGVSSSIAFIGEQPYYPIGNYCSYNFYGYYPQQSIVTEGANKNATVEKSKMTITIPVTGKDDILWGTSKYTQEGVKDTPIKWFTPGEETGIVYNGKPVNNVMDYAYSAKFWRFSPFRTPDTDEPLTPVMKFKHKMIMLKFEVVAGGTAIDENPDDQNYERAYKTEVSGLTIDNAPASIDLVVADLNSNGEEGKVKVSTKKQTLKIDGKATPLKGDNGKPKRTPVLNDGKEAYIILPAETAENYHISLTLKDNNYSPAVTKTIAVPLDLKTKAKFEEGKIYRVVFKIWNMEKVNLDATLDNWEEIDATEEFWDKYPFVTETDKTIPVH